MSFDIGIIGGGQLGRMMIEEAKKMNLTSIVLDPAPDCSCSYVADKTIVGKYDDLEKLIELGKSSKVLSYEFENVPGVTLEKLHNQFTIPQGIQPLLDSQDRLREKDNANKHGLKTVAYYDCPDLETLNRILEKLPYPVLYKTRTEGYDGHGQVKLKSKEDIEKVLPYFEKHIPGIIEQVCPFDYECSLILIRDHKKTITFPIGRNIHKGGILDLSIVPWTMEKSIEERIQKAGISFMESCGYYGILAIEFFIKGNDFYFNEMAPRPHNSGHYTIEGCSINQFRELDKFLIGEDLEEPKLLGPTIMKNILGRDLKNFDKLIKIPNAHVHMYQKNQVRELRKLGHITYTDLTYEQYQEYVKKLAIED